MEIAPRDPSESLIFLRNYWCFHVWDAAGAENPWISVKYHEFSEIERNSMNFNEVALETPKNWFWEVRGRKWVPEWLKYLWITAVFTRWRKGAIFLQLWGILVNSWISSIFMENHKIQRFPTKNEKINFFHKSPTPHETFVFPRPNWWFRAMGPPKPGN